MKKRMLSIIISVVLSVFLTGCSSIGDTDSLLSPPKPEGNLYEISSALQKSVNGKYTLKYPSSGEYRYPIVTRDINGDGVEEAVALYSTVTDNTVNMHINFISKKDEEWVSVGDITTVASGVEQIVFSDLDGDGVEEIIVGWTVYGSVDKSLGIYSVTSGFLAQRLTEKYSDFIRFDFRGDNTDDILIINHSTKDEIAIAKIVELTKDGVAELGTCALNPAVSLYDSPKISRSGDNAIILLDAVKSEGRVTEILEYGVDGLKNITKRGNIGFDTVALRDQNCKIMDINGDGACEIPVQKVLTQSNSLANANVYETVWYGYNSGAFVPVMSAIMNYSDGYYIIVPEKWSGRISVAGDSSSRIRTVMHIDEETGNSADEIVRVRAVAADLFENYSVPNGGFTLARTQTTVYTALINPAYGGEDRVTESEFSELFRILEEG